MKAWETSHTMTSLGRFWKWQIMTAFLQSINHNQQARKGEIFPYVNRPAHERQRSHKVNDLEGYVSQRDCQDDWKGSKGISIEMNSANQNENLNFTTNSTLLTGLVRFEKRGQLVTVGIDLSFLVRLLHVIIVTESESANDNHQNQARKCANRAENDSTVR